MSGQQQGKQFKEPRIRTGRLFSVPTRFRIIGAETILVGSLLVITFVSRVFGVAQWLPSIDSDLPIVGGALIFIGFEIISLIRNLPPLEGRQGRARGGS